ncbi:uncharacterized protein LOC133129173 isoform X2 [Conger conger]|uniref:uncharacterized protein LOC133129173 isoform X2 n=1 Tax=Conger conger TaxID=82655 RepID=UPI002A59A161|nr:uncharacterized protein LOC133129173 isoform X2 [Conger conger]
MGHFVKLYMVLLLLIFFTDDLQAKYIRGTKGKNVTIPFTLQLNNSLTLKYVSLYKDRSKIEESNKEAQDTRRSFSLTSHEAILYISNLSTTDEGKYYVSLYYNELTGKVIESNTTFLQIAMEEHTTVSTPTSNQTWSVTSTTSPHGSFVYIPIIAGIVVCIMILFTLLLGWQYLTYNKSRDCQHSHQEQSPQGSSPKCEPWVLPVKTAFVLET